MIWFILCGIIGAILGGYLIYSDDIPEMILDIVFGLALGELLALILSIFCVAFVNDTDKIPTNIVTTNIYALQDNIGSKGSFFLGSGQIDSDMYYFYAEETDKGIKISKLDQSDCYVKYTDGQPHIDTMFVDVKGWKKYIAISGGRSYYVIYVPKGTIDTSYKIDLQ